MTHEYFMTTRISLSVDIWMTSGEYQSVISCGLPVMAIPPISTNHYAMPRIIVLKVKIVKNERDTPFFTGKLLIKFQNILRNTTQVIVRHRVKIRHTCRVKIQFSIISSPITRERQKRKSLKMKGMLSSPVSW